MPTIVPYSFADLFSLTRASSGWSWNEAGVLTEFAAGAPRYDHDPATLAWRGLLVEEAVTNLALNPRGDGAVVGGSLPTEWGQIAGNLTAAVSGIGAFPDGAPYVEFTVSGTSNGNPQNLYFTETGGLPISNAAAPNDFFALEVGFELLSISSGQARIWLHSQNSSGTTINSNSIQGAVVTPGAPYARYRLSGQLTNANTAGAAGSVRIESLTNGVACNAMFRVGWPQLTTLAWWPSLGMPPAGSPAAFTRAADDLTAYDIGRWFNAAAGTFVVDFMPAISSHTNTRGVLCLDDGTANNRMDIRLPAADNRCRLDVVSGGVSQVANLDTSGTATALARSTLRFSYGPAGFLMSLDGAAPVSAMGTLPAGITAARFGRRHGGFTTEQLNGWLGPRLDYYPVQYTDDAAADGFTIRTR